MQNDKGESVKASDRKDGESWLGAAERERNEAWELFSILKEATRALSLDEGALVGKWFPKGLKEWSDHQGRKLDEMVGGWNIGHGHVDLLMSDESSKPIGYVHHETQPQYRQDPLGRSAETQVWPGEKGSPDQVAVLVRNPSAQSDQAVRVLAEIEIAAELFVQKNRGYGDTGYVLGARGQYADMNRKMGKLKHTLWDGNPAEGESMMEMLQDLIGHAALTLDYLRQENA